jgi:hypothetical protein
MRSGRGTSHVWSDHWRETGLDRRRPEAYAHYCAVLAHLKADGAYAVQGVAEAVRYAGALIHCAVMEGDRQWRRALIKRRAK